MRIALIAIALTGAGQITTPPSFSDKGTFQKGSAGANLDGSSHVSAERGQINDSLVKHLSAWPEAKTGLGLLNGGLVSAAADSFRKSGLLPGLAVTDFLEGKIEASAEAMLKLAEAKPRDLRMLPLLGETVGVAPSFSARMLERLRLLGDSSPKNADAQFYVGKALLKQEPPRAVEAIPFLETAARLDLKATKALMELAREYSAQGKSSLAITALEEAVRRDATLAAAHYRLGMLYREAGQSEKSREQLRHYQVLKEKK